MTSARNEIARLERLEEQRKVRSGARRPPLRAARGAPGARSAPPSSDAPPLGSPAPHQRQLKKNEADLAKCQSELAGLERPEETLDPEQLARPAAPPPLFRLRLLHGPGAPPGLRRRPGRLWAVVSHTAPRAFLSSSLSRPLCRRSSSGG